MTALDLGSARPIMVCPKCGAEHEDFDGVGVVSESEVLEKRSVERQESDEHDD